MMNGDRKEGICRLNVDGNGCDYLRILSDLETKLRNNTNPKEKIELALQGALMFYGADRAYVIEVDDELGIGVNTYHERINAHMEKLITRKEAAKILGISIATLDAARQNGLISYVQYVPNGCVYFTDAALQEYVAKCTKRAKPADNNLTYRKQHRPKKK